MLPMISYEFVDSCIALLFGHNSISQRCISNLLINSYKRLQISHSDHFLANLRQTTNPVTPVHMRFALWELEYEPN